MFFDGSLEAAMAKVSVDVEKQTISDQDKHGHQKGIQTVFSGGRGEKSMSTPIRVKGKTNRPGHMPEKRYIGAFGAVGWATKSGSGLIRHGENVRIERTKPSGFATKVGKGGKQRVALNKRQDMIVRFTNLRGEEVGRLETNSSAWMSTLMDQDICMFEGQCVFAPDRIRTNDTIYLQLRCFLLSKAFDAGTFLKPQDNRQTGLFEAKETQEERDLRLRQTALVKLFDEINLRPSRINETTERHKRQGLLKAAEIAEQYEQGGKTVAGAAAEGTSSPPLSEETEEGQELEQDQLDSLYKKAQAFDFNTPTAEPPSTFAMDLRKYQKQALHWMVSKETEQDLNHKEQSMHPLWEEYLWPTKDVDDKELPEFAELPCFYVNPYSGELSISFPVQEHNCLGGILADGKFGEFLARDSIQKLTTS